MAGEHNSLPRLMSLASHELRTPLSVVSGYVRMLLREQGGPVSDRQRKMLQEVERSCARIDSLASQISEVGKLESGQLKLEQRPFDLAALVAELASRMHEGDDRGIRLEVRGADRPLTIVGDRNRLDAAITALVHRTIRERGGGTVIVIDCSASGGQDPAAVIRISEQEFLEELSNAAAAGGRFEEWEHGGMGLLLPLARRVVEAHRGAVWSIGEKGKTGTALRIPLEVNQV